MWLKSFCPQHYQKVEFGSKHLCVLIIRARSDIRKSSRNLLGTEVLRPSVHAAKSSTAWLLMVYRWLRLRLLVDSITDGLPATELNRRPKLRANSHHTFSSIPSRSKISFAVSGVEPFLSDLSSRAVQSSRLR